MMRGAYLNEEFINHIDKSNVQCILELGSRDGLDAIILSEHYGCKVYAFECNPELIEDCLSNTSEYDDVIIVDKAVWDKEGEITFYPVTNGNVGASSCFIAIDNYPYEEDYEQNEVIVQSIRLDNWLNENGIMVDMLCIDLQGAELTALKGLGDKLKNITYIITEGQVKPMYNDVNLIDEIESYLRIYGFSMVAEKMVNPYFGDFLFVKR